MSQSLECVVGGLEREGDCCREHRHLGCDGEKIRRVLAREVRDRADRSLAPQRLVRERWDVAHVNASAHDNAAALDMRQCSRHQRAHRSEEDGGIERLRGRLLESPAHTAPSRRANACAALSPGRVNANTRRAFPCGDLRDDVRRGAEAVEPEAHRIAGPASAR